MIYRELKKDLSVRAFIINCKKIQNNELQSSNDLKWWWQNLGLSVNCAIDLNDIMLASIEQKDAIASSQSDDNSVYNIVFCIKVSCIIVSFLFIEDILFIFQWH